MQESLNLVLLNNVRYLKVVSLKDVLFQSAANEI